MRRIAVPPLFMMFSLMNAADMLHTRIFLREGCGSMNIAVVCGLIFLVLLVVMLLAGAPIAVALAVSSICAILPVLNTGAAVLTGGTENFFQAYPYSAVLAIPFFILAGNIMNKARYGRPSH